MPLPPVVERPEDVQCVQGCIAQADDQPIGPMSGRVKELEGLGHPMFSTGNDVSQGDAPAAPPWRVAITREEDAAGPWHLALEEAGFVAVSCPVVIEGPAPDPTRHASAANQS